MDVLLLSSLFLLLLRFMLMPKRIMRGFLAEVSVPFDSINSIKLSFYAAQFVCFCMSLSSLANGYLSGCSI